jgi:hypothetical protein
VLADIIPLLGNLMRMGTTLVAGLIASVLSLVTISIAWIVYRPLLGIVLLVLAVGVVILLKKLAAKPKIAPA